MKIKSSYIWAAVVALSVVGWMLSDNLLASRTDEDSGADQGLTITNDTTTNDTGKTAQTESGAAQSGDGRDFIVSAVRVLNEPIRRVIRANGVSEPEFEITVASKIDGTVVKVPAKEGATIDVGDVLVVLDTDTLPAQISAARAEVDAARTALNAAREQSRGTLAEELAAAKANLALAEKRLEISEKLAKQEFSAPLEQVQLKADYENARAALAKIEVAQNFQADVNLSQSMARLEAAKSNLSVLLSQLDDSTILAPAAGRLETIHVDVGERLRRDGVAASILGMDKLSVVVAVPQTSIAQISLGDMVDVNIAGAGTRNGEVTRIASKTNPSTRTFDVEITVPNSDGSLRAGVTVEAAIDVGSVPAFAMSPAHLSVTGEGSLTAKISDNGVVRSLPVKMVRSGAEKVYVSGLADGMILLTVGQAFVEAGDPVTHKLGDAS